MSDYELLMTVFSVIGMVVAVLIAFINHIKK